MLVQGIELDTLPEQFSAPVHDRTLILDGDGPAYVAAATVKRLDTAVRRFQTTVLKEMFLAGASSAVVHLTSCDSTKFGRFRVIGAKPYQGQRTNKAKPALLEPLRHAMACHENWLPEFNVTLHRDIEADDAMMRDAYRLRNNGVIRSDDKDLRMTPFLYFDADRGEVMPAQPVGHVSLKHTPSGTPKLAGQGPMFFWGQMLAGDTADNIQGVRLLQGKPCGAVGAYGALRDAGSIQEAANIVVDAYREIDQNVVAEGWLLWLTRHHEDNVLKYFDEVGLSPENDEFVRDCALREWVKT